LILDRIHEETKKKVKIEYNNMPAFVAEYRDKKTSYKNIIADPSINDAIKQHVTQSYKDSKNDPNNVTAKIINKSYKRWSSYVSNSYSVITELFSGLQYSRITCMACNSIYPNFEPFSVLSVPTPDSSTITIDECFADYCREEVLTDDNRYHCKKCKTKVDCKKQLRIWELPDLLIVHLKRFQKTPGGGRKTESTVTFPVRDLDMRPVLSELHPVGHTKYDLWGVCKHSGTAQGGHYMAYCKNMMNGKWYEFNDDTVNYIPDEYITRELVTKYAYVLFYVRK
jgi:ubiquitin carboxyl-terminal hydrolase 2